MVQLSVVIPAYNERATIREVLRRVQATPHDKEILVVDDGSSDGTREILAGVTDPNVRVLLHERNQGKGAALRTGFAAATGDFLIVQDADLEYDPRDYEKLLEPLLAGDADVVYGSRFAGYPRRVLFFWHTVANQFLTLLSNMTTNMNLTDMETGYKAFRIDVVRRLVVESERFGVEPEITAKIAKLGCRVYEVPISYHGRTYAEGKKIGWRDAVQAVGAIVRYGLLPGRASSHAGYDTLSTMDGLQNYTAWLWKQVAPYVGDRVFEAGCGTGTMTRYLAGREYVLGLDIDEHYVQMMRGGYAGRPNVRIEHADLAAPEWSFLDGHRFDTVVCTNVLEHLPDDRSVMARFHDVLQPGGRVVLVVPAKIQLYGTIDRALGHYRRYERTSLERLLRRTGFEVEELRYLNLTGALGWLLNGRLLRREVVPSGQAALYDRAFPLLSLADRLNPPFGLSVLAVGRKPARPTRASA
ncbi:MAG TPA: glycosyltransferase [Actinoplanes sp.]|jgi:SAM-dependent methyltransferase|nr:glycosyltransferase [Actinoplanes sp.]